MSEITTIPNIGPATQDMFLRAGLSSAEAIRDLGADAAYARLLQSGTRPHFIGYYSLVLGLQGRPWNDCDSAEKRALRVRFDAIVAAARSGGSSELERFLETIGVIARIEGARH